MNNNCGGWHVFNKYLIYYKYYYYISYLIKKQSIKYGTWHNTILYLNGFPWANDIKMLI